MKLGLQLGYWGGQPPTDALEKMLEAEKLGFDIAFTAEAYGSDAFSPLTWYGSQTSRMRLGTSIVQISARTPVSTAMSALTIDHLSGGRLVLGLGVSGPQLDEGFARPTARGTRKEFEIATNCSVVVTDDVEGTLDSMKPMLGFYIGGMGAKDMNFHKEVFGRMGYEKEADEIQDLFFAGERDKPIATVPRQMVAELSLLGPTANIRADPA